MLGRWRAAVRKVKVALRHFRRTGSQQGVRWDQRQTWEGQC